MVTVRTDQKDVAGRHHNTIEYWKGEGLTDHTAVGMMEFVKRGMLHRDPPGA